MPGDRIFDWWHNSSSQSVATRMLSNIPLSTTKQDTSIIRAAAHYFHFARKKYYDKVTRISIDFDECNRY